VCETHVARSEIGLPIRYSVYAETELPEEHKLFLSSWNTLSNTPLVVDNFDREFNTTVRTTLYPLAREFPEGGSDMLVIDFSENADRTGERTRVCCPASLIGPCAFAHVAPTTSAARHHSSIASHERHASVSACQDAHGEDACDEIHLRVAHDSSVYYTPRVAAPPDFNGLIARLTTDRLGIVGLPCTTDVDCFSTYFPGLAVCSPTNECWPNAPVFGAFGSCGWLYGPSAISSSMNIPNPAFNHFLQQSGCGFSPTGVTPGCSNHVCSPRRFTWFWGDCFPGDALVTMDDGSSAAIETLTIGSELAHGGPVVSVEATPAAANATTRTFLNLGVADSGPALVVTSGHIIYALSPDAENKGDGAGQWVYARNVRPGWALYRPGGRANEPARWVAVDSVSELELDVRVGAYSPVTKTGRLVVNGFLVSSSKQDSDPGDLL